MVRRNGGDSFPVPIFSRWLCGKPVTRPAHRFDVPVVVSRFQGFSQPADMDVHGAFFDENMVAPDLVEQLCTGVHPFGMGHEEVEQAEFRGPQGELGPVSYTHLTLPTKRIV